MSNKSSNHRTTKAISKTKTDSVKGQKRKKSHSSPETTPIAKKIPIAMGDRPVTFDDIKSLFAEQTATITDSNNKLNQNIQNEMTTMKNELKSCFDQQINQINDRISAVETQVNRRIDEIAANINQGGNSRDDDDLKRIAKLNNLKISGITHMKDQNLSDIFNIIAKKVEFDTSNPVNVPTLVRLYRKNEKTKLMSPSPIIIMKFVARHIRESFYTHYLNKIVAKQFIMSEDFGLEKGTRTVIGEDLTENNSKLFAAAMKLKKEGKLCQSFTNEGLVHVKALKTDKATAIRSNLQLEVFVQSKTSTEDKASGNLHNDPTAKDPSTSTTTTSTPMEVSETVSTQ